MGIFRGKRLLFSYASLTNVCSLVLDRYIAFAKPLKYSTCITAGRRVFHTIFFFLGDLFLPCDDSRTSVITFSGAIRSNK